jgi:hypothetical protein
MARTASLVLAASVFALSGCPHHPDGGDDGDMTSPPVDDLPLVIRDMAEPDLAPPPPGPDMTTPGGPPDMSGFSAPFDVPLNATSKMDILFMIDNSSSMDAMQSELKARFPSFIQPFIDLAAAGVYTDLHIGVITSDYGAGDKDGGGCQKSPGGQQGLLSTRGSAANADCTVATGVPYIRYKFGPGGADDSNLPGGNTTTALAQQFTCAASVGGAGCGFEHQLESVYAALHNNAQNGNFLRADALLAIVLVTNEDDGSAPPSVTYFENSADVATYGAYDTFRQTRFAISCGGQSIPYADVNGNGLPQLLAACAGTPNPTATLNVAYDVSRYTSVLTQPGGVKASPDDVVLVSIAGPPAPFQTILAQKGTGLGQQPNPTYQACGPLLSDNCLMRMQHSCQNSITPAFFADPAVRIDSVVQAAPHHQAFSICGDDLGQAPDYAGALTASANLAKARILGNCVPVTVADPQNPDCRVIETVDGVPTTLPRCDQGQPPCWTLVDEPSCGHPNTQAYALRITPAVGPTAPGTTVTASCRMP